MSIFHWFSQPFSRRNKETIHNLSVWTRYCLLVGLYAFYLLIFFLQFSYGVYQCKNWCVHQYEIQLWVNILTHKAKFHFFLVLIFSNGCRPFVRLSACLSVCLWTFHISAFVSGSTWHRALEGNYNLLKQRPKTFLKER